MAETIFCRSPSRFSHFLCLATSSATLRAALALVSSLPEISEIDLSARNCIEAHW
ncbi:MAG: hypothetical protein Ct9H300mP1_26060 [Planctomycetaceae bacterium]|nr:MAG: hypothetical protein Ct9H300mP1_26060 [Planctomycetaceae bacterium]